MSKSEKTPTQLFQVIRRWWWLLVLAPLLASAVGYFLNKDAHPGYEAEAQLMIGPDVDSPNPDLNSLRAGGFIAQNYKKLAATDNFLQAVILDLNLDMSINKLKGMINLNTDPNSLIMTINVISTKRELSINIANAVAKELFNMSPANPNNPSAIMLEQNRARLNALNETIKQTESKLSGLEADLQKLDQQAYSVNDLQNQTLDAAEIRVNYLEIEYQKLTSVATESQMGSQILNELRNNSLLRLHDLENDLPKTDPDLQNLVLDQIDAENNNLSALQKTLLELQQYFEGKPLDEYIQYIQTNIAELNKKYSSLSSYDISNRRFISDKIDQETNRLTDAEKIAADRRLKVSFRLSEERGRLSAMKVLPITERLEKRQLISDQINYERGHLNTLQNSRAALSDDLLKSWTNQIQITQLASTAVKVPSNLGLIVLSACIAGLAAAMALVLAIEYFEDSGQYVRDLATLFDIPLLGRIQITRSTNITQLLYANQSVVKTLPLSVTVDDYRLMAVKILLQLNPLNPLRTILICDLNSEDNASEIASNLAVVLAQTGNSVLLVDSTLREPVNAQLIRTDTVIGSSITLAHAEPPIELLAIPEVENLYILPISPLLPDPFGLFAPTQVPEVINSLKKYAAYILIAGSNLMSSAKTFGLASRVDGLILVTPDKGLKRDQVDNLMKNESTYKWGIIGTVRVKIRTSLHPFQNQQWAHWFGKRWKILGKNSAFQEKEGALKEPNDFEGQSL